LAIRGSGFKESFVPSILAYFAYLLAAPHKNIVEHYVTLVTGGAILGFDDRVHIDLDCAHTALTPDHARQFAAKLKRIADVIDPPSKSD
jgi:hypothetical protein